MVKCIEAWRLDEDSVSCLLLGYAGNTTVVCYATSS